MWKICTRKMVVRKCLKLYICTLHRLHRRFGGGHRRSRKNMNKIRAEKMNSVQLDIVSFFSTFLFHRAALRSSAFFFFCVVVARSFVVVVAKTLIISNVSHFHCGIVSVAATSTQVVYAFYVYTRVPVFFLFAKVELFFCWFISQHQQHQSYNDNFCCFVQQMPRMSTNRAKRTESLSYSREHRHTSTSEREM